MYQHSASHTWIRMARCMAAYGGEFDRNFYQILLKETEPYDAIKRLQDAGIVFDRKACHHWAIEICGAFEVTGSRYRQPKGSDLPDAMVLYNTMLKVFGYQTD